MFKAFVRKKINSYILSNTDVIFLSFPKSGRTWVRYFLGKYLERLYGIGFSFDYARVFMPKKVNRFLFTHASYFEADIRSLESDLQRYKNKHVCLLVRDPRDVVVSFFHHNKKRKSYLGGGEMTADEFIRHKQLGISRIVEYLNEVYKLQHLFKEFEIIRYEDLQSEKNTFKKIISFIGQPYDDAAFTYAIQESSFDNMRKTEREKQVDTDILQPTDINDTNSYKVRKGKVGSYVDELSLEQIEYCNRVAKNLNPDFGY